MVKHGAVGSVHCGWLGGAGKLEPSALFFGMVDPSLCQSRERKRKEELEETLVRRAVQPAAEVEEDTLPS